MSGLASNDVVILTMTPFLVYFSQAVELATPIAFLMAELQTANIGKDCTLIEKNVVDVFFFFCSPPSFPFIIHVFHIHLHPLTL